MSSVGRGDVPVASRLARHQGPKIAHKKSTPQKSSWIFGGIFQWIFSGVFQLSLASGMLQRIVTFQVELTGIVQWMFSGIFKWMFIVCDFWCVISCPVSSLRRGHANLLYVVPTSTDDPPRESRRRPGCSLVASDGDARDRFCVTHAAPEKSRKQCDKWES